MQHVSSCYIKDLNKKMRAQGRKVLLFIDNAPSHPHSLSQLSNIKVAFFPPNATYKLQPLDLGIIQNVKLLYRKRLLRAVLAKVDSGMAVQDIQKSISVLDACQWISASVKEVRAATVSKCFSKAGFEVLEDTEDDFDEEDNIPLARLVEEVHNHMPESRETPDPDIKSIPGAVVYHSHTLAMF